MNKKLYFNSWNPDIYFLERTRSDSRDWTGETKGRLIVHKKSENQEGCGTDIIMDVFCTECGEFRTMKKSQLLNHVITRCFECGNRSHVKVTDKNRNYIRR